MRSRVVGNRYTIEREIGRGGMATVWLADDGQHGRKVAIKTLHPELAGAIGTDRFLREIRLTAQLQHPGIVPILDSGTVEFADGTPVPWYAMPYLTGESLRERLNREAQLPIDEALRIADAVGRTLEAAHQRDVVHRDIKPENVFLSGQQVYVVDFGIARALAVDADRLTSTGLAIGTPTYMSPEQAVAGTVDARSDQYSLAAMLYEMLAGEPPFAGPNPTATIARRLAEPARPISPVRSTVPPHVERAVLRALERTPADRFTSVGAFLGALRAPGVVERKLFIQARSAAIVVGSLVVAVAAWLVVWPREKAVDPEVLSLYQRGVQAYDTRTPDGVVQAISALHDAIRRDSSYAPAWTALAKAYARAYQRGFQVPDIAHDELLRRAVDAVNRSLALDDRNADAWMTRGIVSHQVDGVNIGPSLRDIRRSLALDSTQAPAWHHLAIMTADSSGSVETSMEYWRRSVRVDPGYSQALAFMAFGHYWRGAYDSAAVWADSAMSVDPTYLLARQAASVIAIEQGKYDEAASHADAALNLSSGVEIANSMANQALVKARHGNRPLAMATALGAEVVAGRFPPMNLHSAVYIAEVHAATGDAFKAMSSLGSYSKPREGHFQLHLRCSPTFAPIENDSAFKALLVRPRPAPGSHC